MIICICSTIGKTTLASKRNDIIELKGGDYQNKAKNFNIENWWELLAKDAVDFNNQGYTVLTSTRLGTVRYLLTLTTDIAIIFYNKNMKESAFKKALSRNKWTVEELTKKYSNFEQRIETLNDIVNKNNIPFFIIDNENYNLEEIVDNLIKENCYEK